MMAHPISPIVFAGEAYSDDDCSAASSIDSPIHAYSDLMEDQLIALLRLESTYRVEQIPCSNVSSDDRNHVPHDEWRRKITEWSYRVVDHFRIDREVVSVAMNYFDRFLSKHKVAGAPPGQCQCPSCRRMVDSRTFQLAAMTCLYLAIKLHAESCGADGDGDRSSRRKKIRLVSFVELSRGQFSPDDLCEMELCILETLQWKVNPTTPTLVVSYLLQLMPTPMAVPMSSRCHYDLVLHVLNELARYLSELSICLSNLSSAYLSSEVAYAAILLSMDMLTLHALPLSVRQHFTRALADLSAPGDGSQPLDPSNPRVRYLMGRLRQCFWPEMLMDDTMSLENDHPIALARSAGLLDFSHMCPKQLGRNKSATSVIQVSEHDQLTMEETPICVTP